MGLSHWTNGLKEKSEEVGQERNFQLLLPSLNGKQLSQRVFSGHLEIGQGFITEFPQEAQGDALISNETVERKQQGGHLGGTSISDA
jgi:hypothetical protein